MLFRTRLLTSSSIGRATVNKRGVAMASASLKACKISNGDVSPGAIFISISANPFAPFLFYFFSLKSIGKYSYYQVIFKNLVSRNSGTVFPWLASLFIHYFFPFLILQMFRLCRCSCKSLFNVIFAFATIFYGESNAYR